MDEKQVLVRLQASCSRREYCSSDVLEKALKAMDGDADAAQRICEALKKDRFVDDLRYASAFVREKSRLSGWGPVKISHALRAKGLDAATVDKALGEADPEEAAGRMRQVLEAKDRQLRGDPVRKLKLLRFGLSRGYLYEQVAPVVEELMKREIQ